MEDLQAPFAFPALQSVPKSWRAPAWSSPALPGLESFSSEKLSICLSLNIYGAKYVEDVEGESETKIQYLKFF